MKCRTKLPQSRVDFNHGANFLNEILIFPYWFWHLLNLCFTKQRKLVVRKKKRPGPEARMAPLTVNGSMILLPHVSSGCVQGKI